MAKPMKRVWTPSVDILWDGELEPEFRAQADSILSTKLSDDAWLGLCRCVRAYSMALSHEFTAAPFKDQVKALARVAAAAAELQSAIGSAQTQELGFPVTNLVSDTWEQVYDHIAEFEHNQGRMVEDLEQALSTDDAWGLLASWRAAGRIQYPSPVADFLVSLGQFTTAAHMASKELEGEKSPSSRQGEAFQGFVAMLFQWKTEHVISAGVSKGSGSKAGRLTHLVRAVLDQIPLLKDEHGVRAIKQLRPAYTADISLAGAILDARRAYELDRP